MSLDLNKIKKLFETSAVNLKERMDRLIEENKLPGKIVSGSWLNQNKIVGSLSYFPTGNNSEETIDYVFEVDVNLHTFTSDVCTSSGKILYPIKERMIETRVEDELPSQLLSLIEESSQKYASWFEGQNWKEMNNV